MQVGMKTCLSLLFVVSVWSVVSSTLSKSDKEKSSKKKKNQQTAALSVFDRGLVQEDVKKKHIIDEHANFSPLEQDVKNFNGPVLGYVTPWNSHGYDVAKMFGAKFTHISPVWLQIKRKPGGAFVIDGGHDIDKGWVKEVKRGGSISIVPRILFDGWNYADYQAVFGNEDVLEDCMDVLVGYIKDKKFSGAVIEIWSQLGGNLREQLIHFLTHLADAMHRVKKILVLVIPPAIQSNGSPGMFGEEDFHRLVGKVDYFSLMTYDFTNDGRPGPSSPFMWAKQCVETICPKADRKQRAKILLGLNFYGYHYLVNTKTEPIMGQQFVELLKKQKPSPNIRWDADAYEHVFEFKSSMGQHIIRYPTLHSIHKRLQLAGSLGTGLSIWELGQGMDYFYDML